MTMEQLLALLGCEDATQAVAAITRMNAFLNDARTITGRTSSAESMDGMRSLAQLARSIESSIGAQGGECVARIEALKTSADRLKEAEARVVEMQRAQADLEAGQLIAASVTEGRLEPAKEETARQLYADYGVKALKSFLDMLPQTRVGGDAPRQPPKPNAGPGTRASGDASASSHAEDLDDGVVTQLAKAMGKDPSEIRESHKHWSETKGQLSEGTLHLMNAQQQKRIQTQLYGAR